MALVKPAFEEFCLPTKKFADVIIPRGMANNVAINIIVQEIKAQFQGKKNKKEKNKPAVQRQKSSPGTVH